MTGVITDVVMPGLDEGPQVPRHWSIRKLKFLADVRLSSVDKKRVDGEQDVRLCNYTDVYNNDTIRDSMDFMVATASFTEIDRFELQKGDVIVTKDSESWNDIAVPAYVAEDLDTVLCGYHLALIRPRAGRLDGRFLRYAFAAQGIAARLHVQALGVTRFALGYDALASALIPLPALSEQHAIAAFLDRETARLDALIAKKERLVALLEEKRTALITRTVTKGLDPVVPMKESGVQWLGEVPSHWAVSRVRHVVRRIEQGWSPECENRMAEPDEWGVLKAGCVNEGRFDEDEHKTLPSDLPPVQDLEVHAGDVLMSRASGSEDLVGSIAYVERCRPRLLLSDKLFRLRIREDRVRPMFLVAALNSRPVRAQIEAEISGAGGLANNIGQVSVRNLTIGLPPIAEQVSIVASLNRTQTFTVAATAKIRSAITLLREYRTALISAAVTGQIQIGESSPRLERPPDQ